MYPVLHELLSDKKGGTVFTCFGVWHFCYILAALAVIAAAAICVRKRGRGAAAGAARTFVNLGFGLYVADFFLMPFAYEAIDIEKLPFHVCTATCVACFLCAHVRGAERFRAPVALLGMISNFVYLIYPAGVMWYAVHPLSYRVVQTLAFHGIMTAAGFFTLIAEGEAVAPKAWRRWLAVCSAMTLWALLGNTLYRGAAGTYDHDFNWFFVERDPFGLFPAALAPWIMPFLNTALFFAVGMAVLRAFAPARGKHKER